MGKSKKSKKVEQPPVSEAPPQENSEARTWTERFDNSNHHHFLKMSAEAMQEAMNLASRTGKVEDLLNVAQFWGNLAVTARDLEKGRTGIGFGQKDGDSKND